MNSTATISARTEAVSYEASNLSRHELFPGWRSADKALDLTGHEFVHTADHADLDIAGDFSLEFLVYIPSLDTESIATAIYDKGNSIRATQNDAEFELILYNSTASWTHSWTISAIGWYRVKWVFDVSAAIVTLYVNGTGETGNLSSAGTAFDPADAIDTNADRVTIGATDDPAIAASIVGINIFTGKLAYLGIAPAEYDNSAYLDPALSNAYWNFDSDDLTDSSGLGSSHTLTSSISLDLNGTDEYATHADNADFDITGDLTTEIIVTPDTVSGNQTLIGKGAGTGANNSYFLRLTNDEIDFRGSGDGSTLWSLTTTAANLVAGTPYIIKAAYDASAFEVSFFVNGAEIARGNNGTQTNCTLGGTVTNSLFSGTGLLSVGATQTGVNLFDGEIAFVGIKAAEEDNGAYLVPSTTAGYWNWDAGDLTDSSGNNHTLTGVGLAAGNFVDDIASGDFVDSTAYHFLGLEFTGNQNPTAAIVAAQHNLTGSATIKLWRGDWHSTTTDPTLVATLTAAADTVIIDRAVSGSNDTFWFLEIHDPDNPDGFLALPYVYLGSVDTFTVDFIMTPAPTLSEPRAAIFNTNAIGNLRTYVLSNQIHSGAGTLKFTNAADLVTLQSLAASAGQGEPFFLVWDKSTPARALDSTWLVYWINAAEFPRSMMVMGTPTTDATWNIPFTFRELAEESD